MPILGNMREFVAGWDVLATLGEGAYGEVWLIMNRDTNEAVAAKSIDIHQHINALIDVRKEIRIHRLLEHENVIKFFGHREEEDSYFIFLEYASGGELYDKIRPDYGMAQALAHRYFTQIIAGVEYLHSRGVAHRDLKPENILLSSEDNIKITDFGLATIFRHKGKERMLNKRCGTLPYVSPEVFTREYKAEPSDIWSCGIILVTMLSGELPWDRPTVDCENYELWIDGKLSQTPWCKINNLALSLIKKILDASPSKRYTISQIKEHLWFTTLHKMKGSVRWEGELIRYKRQYSDVDQTYHMEKDEELTKISCSQPAPFAKVDPKVDLHAESLDVLKHGICFSQPSRPEHMILSGSQLAATPGACKASLDKLIVKRMTRFFVEMEPDAAVDALKLALDKLGYSWKKSEPGQVMISTLDRRQMQLTFKATLIEMDRNILVDFRLSKGDGIEFKRHFLSVQKMMTHLIVKDPGSWAVDNGIMPIAIC